jgi:hypothetical protein
MGRGVKIVGLNLGHEENKDAGCRPADSTHNPRGKKNEVNRGMGAGPGFAPNAPGSDGVVTGRGREGKEKETKARNQHQHQKLGTEWKQAANKKRRGEKGKTKEIESPVVEPKINFGGAQPCQRRWIGVRETRTRRGVTEPRVYWEASQPSPGKNTHCSQRHFQVIGKRGGSCKTGVIILYSIAPLMG